MTEHDAVNHPSHYTSDPSGVECIAITRHRNFDIGNAIKYLWRAGLKESASAEPIVKQIEDLEKARWYIADEIERLRSGEPEIMFGTDLGSTLNNMSIAFKVGDKLTVAPLVGGGYLAWRPNETTFNVEGAFDRARTRAKTKITNTHAACEEERDAIVTNIAEAGRLKNKRLIDTINGTDPAA